jgi:transcriptional regulator with XRE-family HTH domain
MNVEEAVGTELSACRRKKRISQERLGFDAGVHRTYVSLIERGVKSPTVGHALSVISGTECGDDPAGSAQRRGCSAASRAIAWQRNAGDEDRHGEP